MALQCTGVVLQCQLKSKMMNKSDHENKHHPGQVASQHWRDSHLRPLSMDTDICALSAKTRALNRKIAFYAQHFASDAVNDGYVEPGRVVDRDLQRVYGPDAHFPLYIQPADFITVFGRIREDRATKKTQSETTEDAEKEQVVLKDSPAQQDSTTMQDQATMLRIKQYMQRRFAERRTLCRELATLSARMEKDWHGRVRKREAEWGDPEDLGVPSDLHPASNPYNTPAQSYAHPQETEAGATGVVPHGAHAASGVAGPGYYPGAAGHVKGWRNALAQWIPVQEALRAKCLLPAVFFPVWRERPMTGLQRELAHPVWSSDEKKIFIELYLQHPKNFARIAAHLPFKSCEQCVQFYYQHKKEYRLKQMVASYRRAMVVQRRMILNTQAAANSGAESVSTTTAPSEDSVSVSVSASASDSLSTTTRRTGKTGRSVGRPKNKPPAG